MSKIYITYWKTKIKKFSVEVRLFEIQYLKTKAKTKNLERYMKFSLKIGLLFFVCKVIVKWKWKLRNNRGALEDFKMKKERKTRKRKKRKKKKKKKRKTNFFTNRKKS